MTEYCRFVGQMLDAQGMPLPFRTVRVVVLDMPTGVQAVEVKTDRQGSFCLDLRKGVTITWEGATYQVPDIDTLPFYDLVKPRVTAVTTTFHYLTGVDSDGDRVLGEEILSLGGIGPLLPVPVLMNSEITRTLRVDWSDCQYTDQVVDIEILEEDVTVDGIASEDLYGLLQLEWPPLREFEYSVPSVTFSPVSI